MDKLMENQNFDLIMALADREWDNVELIFEFLDHDTVEICRKVSKYWEKSLEKMSRVKFLEEFGHKNVCRRIEKVSEIIPGWQRAVKKFAARATNEDLIEVQKAVTKLVMEDDKCLNRHKKSLCMSDPVHRAARDGDVKLLKLFLMTSYDMNTRARKSGGLTTFHSACKFGSTEVVQLFFQYSKEHEIDLNTRDYFGRTVLHSACDRGNVGTVRLIMNNLKEFAIDIKNAQDNFGKTALYYIEERMRCDPENADFIECSKILCQPQKRCI